MIGVDEVGRGAIAGPLLVCALRLNKKVKGLKDSKQLTKEQREALAKKIAKSADFGLGWVSSKYIDKYGLTAAHKLAAKRALKQLDIESGEKIILDGSFNYLPKKYNTETVVKADELIADVSAASIIAKVSRDNFMQRLHLKTLHYCFDENVGYCTKKHIDVIKTKGLSEHHRKSFQIKENAWQKNY